MEEITNNNFGDFYYEKNIGDCRIDYRRDNVHIS
jgi:hypothetical protein